MPIVLEEGTQLVPVAVDGQGVVQVEVRFLPARLAGRRPLAVVTHGTNPAENQRRRFRVESYDIWSEDLRALGFNALVIARPGWGNSQGIATDIVASCEITAYDKAAKEVASQVGAVIRALAPSDSIALDQIVAMGASGGGWGMLALAGSDVPGLIAVVNLAGAQAWRFHYKTCDLDPMIASARKLGGESRVPSLWVYARGDSRLPDHRVPDLVAAYRAGAGQAAFYRVTVGAGDPHGFMFDLRGRLLLWHRFQAFAATLPIALD
ncbi:MAG: hypothetical protein JNK11_16405 [Alphaproteobacteria bacterium]|nr:hypothetical protein [Alphaproteobacteria bacterium]